MDKIEQLEQVEVKKLSIKVPTNLSKYRDQDKLHVVQAAENQSTSDKQPETTTITPEDNIQDFTIFVKDCGVKLDVKNAAKAQDVQVKLADQKKLLHLNFDYDNGLKIDSTSPSEHVESLSEYTWREIKLDSSKLPEYYLKLSKIRLTGQYFGMFILLWF